MPSPVKELWLVTTSKAILKHGKRLVRMGQNLDVYFLLTKSQRVTARRSFKDPVFEIQVDKMIEMKCVAFPFTTMPHVL